MNRPIMPGDTAEAVELPLHDTNPREPTPHERRQMLIEGTKEFDAKFGRETPEEAVDRMIAEGKVSLTPPACDEPDPNDFDWSTEPSIVIHEQPATAMYFNPVGMLVIRQKADWDREEDTFVYIAPNNIEAFLDQLADMLGVPSAGGPSKPSAEKR